MREHLLGYLLDALDDGQHEMVRVRLEEDAQLRHELQRLQEHVAPSADIHRHHDPPEGLASRTCDLIAQRCRSEENWVTPASRPADEAASAPQRGGWSLADMIVVAGVIIAAAMLFFPAIANSRYQAQLAGCQNNLRQLAVALTQYSTYNRDYFPYIPPRGQLAFNGSYSMSLFEANYLDNAAILICPASNLASRASVFRIPQRQELQNARGATLVQLKRDSGGSYGYVFGYVDEDGNYRATRNLRRVLFAVMSDTPSQHMPGYQSANSANHGGCGQNVLFEDGHVVYLRSCKLGGCNDDFFRSTRGFVEPGRNRDDSVIARSDLAPLVHPVKLGN